MAGLEETLASRFAAAVSAAFGPEHAGVDPLIRPSTNEKFGDFQCNLAMSLAKQLGRKPREMAEQIVKHLDWQGVCEELPGVAGPGFINLKIAGGLLSQQVGGLAGDARLGVPAAAPPQTVVVDYSGVNVAKEMLVWHLRSTIIGDCLARVLEFQGHRVIRQNHLGDWGTQFGMLIEYLLEQGASQSGSPPQISDLNDFYKQAKQRFDSVPDFADRGRRRVVALQSGDPPTLALWQALVEASQLHFDGMYRRLGVSLTRADVRAESAYNALLPDVVAELERAGLAHMSDGALCVFPPGFIGQEGKPVPMIIRKSDGGYLYATTDLAALRFRIRQLHAERVIYVTDSRQAQHFAMLFKTAELAEWLRSTGTAVRIEHVPFGTVLGEDGTPFKTRAGESVKLASLLDEAEKRAYDLVTVKNAELPEAERRAVAHAVGIGAVKYADLCNDRVKDYVFSWGRMLSFDGNTAPYLQYSYVRIRSIFRKAGSVEIRNPKSEIRVTEPGGAVLGLKLLQFASVVAAVSDSLEPHRLCTFLYELASAYHRFYEACPVLSAADAETRASRLALCDLTARVLRQGLDLLGIEVVEQM